MSTLDSTFAKFFAPTENTSGTGRVIRSINGTLTSVTVDQVERDAFLAKVRADTEARKAHENAIDELMEVLN